MYLNSSYDFLVIKSLYAAVLREIELGHSTWGDDFQYVESTVLARHTVKTKSKFFEPSQTQFRPKPSYELPQENDSTGREDTRIWFCSKYQRNKCTFKGAHMVNIKGGKTRYAKHVCATCWNTDKKELAHPECSNICPHTAV